VEFGEAVGDQGRMTGGGSDVGAASGGRT
jgi:hypothetical protein